LLTKSFCHIRARKKKKEQKKTHHLCRFSTKIMEDYAEPLQTAKIPSYARSHKKDLFSFQPACGAEQKGFKTQRALDIAVRLLTKTCTKGCKDSTIAVMPSTYLHGSDTGHSFEQRFRVSQRAAAKAFQTNERK
jgi:hypothetical protein